MQPRSSDEAAYRLLTAPEAALSLRLEIVESGEAELQFLGNRAGLLSLANVLLWLVANSWRREFLTLAELPFVRVEPPLSVCIRLADAESTGRSGLIERRDRGQQFEWVVPEDDLQRVALTLHRLASNPGHEYDRLRMAEGSVAGVHVRMTDAAEWLQ